VPGAADPAQTSHFGAIRVEGTQGRHKPNPVKTRKNAHDILGVLSYKSTRTSLDVVVTLIFTPLFYRSGGVLSAHHVVAASAALGSSVSIRG
jgi:hypothetical protein